MKLPYFNVNQFLGDSLLNDAVTLISDSLKNVGNYFHSAGLINASDISVVASGNSMVATISSGFAVLFDDGTLADALNASDGSTASSGTVDFSSLIPGSGSATAYLVATATSNKQSAFTVVGPPPGHPDYSPNFQSYKGYTEQQDTFTLSATTTAPNNTTDIEIARCTLTAGQSSIASIDTSHQLLSHIAQTQTQNFAIDTGTADAYAVTLSPPLPRHIVGMPIRFVAANSSTGAACTFNDGNGSASLVTPSGDNPAITSGGLYTAIFDGTNFQILTDNGGSLYTIPGDSAAVQEGASIADTSGAFVTVGPSGSGADHLMYGFSAIPDYARKIVCLVQIAGEFTLTASGTHGYGQAAVHALENGVSPFGGYGPKVGNITLDITQAASTSEIWQPYNDRLAVIPLDSNRMFQVRFDTTKTNISVYASNDWLVTFTPLGWGI